MPATFLPPICTSLGHLMLASTPESRSVSASATAATRVISGAREGAISGRRITLSARLLPAGRDPAAPAASLSLGLVLGDDHLAVGAAFLRQLEGLGVGRLEGLVVVQRAAQLAGGEQRADLERGEPIGHFEQPVAAGGLGVDAVAELRSDSTCFHTAVRESPSLSDSAAPEM